MRSDQARRRPLLLPALFSVGMVALALAPVVENWRERPDDGFPFSHYPMFSQPLGETYEVTHAVGFAADGREIVVPSQLVGTGGLNEVLTQLRREAAEDASALCRRLADSLREPPRLEQREVLELAIVTGEYRMAPFYEGRIEAATRVERARCRVAP